MRYGGLRIGGLSGIYKARDYGKGGEVWRGCREKEEERREGGRRGEETRREGEGGGAGRVILTSKFLRSWSICQVTLSALLTLRIPREVPIM